MRQSVNIDEQYGKWTVVGFNHGQRNRIQVRCECGTEQATTTNNLVAGKTTQCRSCAGKNNPGNVKRRATDDSLARNEVWHEYQKSARDRNLEFSIPRDIFFQYITLPCYLCGSDELSNEKRIYNKPWALPFKYNGLDRFDNSKGYTRENVMTCCRICNFLKRDLSFEDLIERIQKIHAIWGHMGQPKWVDTEGYPQVAWFRFEGGN